MPINVLVSSQKFYNEFKNEIGFGANLSDFTFNFTGEVMERVKFVQEVDVSWGVSYTSPDGSAAGFAWDFVFSGTLCTITRDAGDFSNDGFSIGDNVDLHWFTTSLTTYDSDVVAINQDVMVIQMGVGSLPVSPTSIALFGDSPLEALVYTFGQIPNNGNFSVNSLVTGNDQGYYASNIGFDTGGGVRDTNFVEMTRLGQYRDWQTGSSRVRFVVELSGFVQRFEIEHDFIITPFYLDGELPNLQGNIAPTIFSGVNTLKYVYDASFRTSLSNPNTKKPVVFQESLGSIGWFNENFSGFQNNYEITSVTYEEAITTAPADGILIGSETRIKVTVERISGAFSGAERFGAYISYLPEQNEYQNTQISNLTENFIYDRALNYAGLAGVTGDDFITDMVANVVGGNLEIEIVMEYDLLQKAFLSQKFASQATYFMLGIEVGDNTLVSGNSDRVMILADTKLYDQSPDIADLMHTTKFDLYTHEKQIGVDTGTTDAVTWNEDGLVVDFEFDVNLNLEAKLNSLNFVLVAFNNVTGRYWEIDNYMFSPAISVISGGVQQIFEDTTRGYILKIDDQFNDVEIGVGTQAAGLQKYSGRFAQKMSWQNWIQDLDVDTVFFDNAEQFTNFNKKSSNYSLLNNYTIKLGIFSNVDGVSPLGVSGATDYLFLSPDIRVFDYEEDGNIPAVWSCVIETFNIGGLVNLGGAILTGQDTLFRTTWTNSNGPVATLTNLYGINRLEETNQPGYAITELSSLNLPLPTNQQVLKPSVGTLLDMTLVGGNVVMECLIDGNIALNGVNYNLSSRIHNSVPIVVSGKVTEAGVLKITESSIQKIIE